MQTFTIIIGILILVLSFISFFGLIALSDGDSFLGIISLVFITIILAIGGTLLLRFAIYGNDKPGSPKAIDVYRNKTELVYDYHSNGTYDSLVVWKGVKK